MKTLKLVAAAALVAALVTGAVAPAEVGAWLRVAFEWTIDTVRGVADGAI